MLKSLKQSVATFHNNESGMEALQTVMILAIAALVLSGVSSISGVSKGGQSGGFLGSIKDVIGGFLGGAKGGIGGLLGL